jgi:hypothetical protein
MRDYRVTYKSIPLVSNSSSGICLAQNPVLHGREKYIKVRHHFLRDYVEKGDKKMKYIDAERQLADIFTKPLDVTYFASLQRGNLVFAIPMAWFEGDLVFILYILYLIFIALYFIHIYLIYLVLHLLC